MFEMAPVKPSQFLLLDAQTESYSPYKSLEQMSEKYIKKE